MSSNPDIINFNAEMEKPVPAGDRMKKKIARYVDIFLSGAYRIKELCISTSKIYEIESQKFFFINGKKKKEAALKRFNIHNKFLDEFNDIIADLQAARTCLDGDKIMPDTFIRINKAEDIIERYKQQLMDETDIVHITQKEDGSYIVERK